MFFLSGCGKSKLEEVNHRTSEHVSKPFKKNRIEQGYLIAFYNLAESECDKKNYLFNPRYASLINDDVYLKQYAESVKDKVFSLKQMNTIAKQKVNLMLSNIYLLQKKYKSIPNPPLFLRVKMKLNIGNYLDHLSVLDQYYSNLPILSPEEKAYITSRYGNRCMEIISRSFTKSGNFAKKKSKRKSIAKQFSRSRVCKTHYGIDIKSSNTDIYASGGGVVIAAYRAPDFGNNIIIDHGHNIRSRYAHLDKIRVKVGEQVARGQNIGIQGNSGRSSGPHLHFEIIIKNQRINPEDFIKFLEIFDYRR